ncbi:MAG: YggS family pyridoxal phosphate-dependent enzyme [Oscillospiraceae bacterium]|nr:YggS family pyridoxal phosphate-dependent enzyme [Oscillospiraceae bacterium]
MKLQDEERFIKHNISAIQTQVAEAADKYGRSVDDISIMAVTKTVSAECVNIAIDCGISLLGENRSAELVGKYDEYNKKNIKIHFIGHLQSNKVKAIIDKVDMIQSLDSLKLAQEIGKRAEPPIDVLVEVNIGNEQGKFGINPATLCEFLEQTAEIGGIRVMGLMCIPPQIDSDIYFGKMQELFLDIREKKLHNVNMGILSMGMSGDYVEAIKHGSNIIRIGRNIFGERNYIK